MQSSNIVARRIIRWFNYGIIKDEGNIGESIHANFNGRINTERQVFISILGGNTPRKKNPVKNLKAQLVKCWWSNRCQISFHIGLIRTTSITGWCYLWYNVPKSTSVSYAVSKEQILFCLFLLAMQYGLFEICCFCSPLYLCNLKS